MEGRSAGQALLIQRPTEPETSTLRFELQSPSRPHRRGALRGREKLAKLRSRSTDPEHGKGKRDGDQSIANGGDSLTRPEQPKLRPPQRAQRVG